MRLTTFWERMQELLGSAQADAFARYRVLSELGDRTVLEALDAGQPAKEVWRVVCDVTDAPSRLR
ncbi:MAG: DUF3046 domain-containing protein [Actinomycetes bacterium]